MYKLLLCQRYLRSRYIALASIISVTLGVATMIVVNSVMAGFSSEMRNRIQGILSDIIIDTMNYDGEWDPELHKQIIREMAGKYVAGVTATVEVHGMLSFEHGGQYIHHPVSLIGIDPETKAQVGPLKDYLQSYHVQTDEGKVVPAERMRDAIPGWELTESGLAERRRLAELGAQRRRFLKEIKQQSHGGREANPQNENPNKREPAPINPFDEDQAAMVDADAEGTDPAELLDARVYLGAGLISYPHTDEETGKTRMIYMVRPGQDVKISTVTAGTPSPAYFSATVVDVFKSGMSEYDSNLVFCNLEHLQRVRKMLRENEDGTVSSAVTSIQIKLKDYRDAQKVVDLLRTRFTSDRYSVKTWERKQGPLLAAVDVESSILNVLLFLIITVAGFGILAIFFMIVVEKTRDIGVLKALGASSNGVMSIFLGYGLALGIVGSGVGVVLGLLFVRYINQIEKVISLVTGHKVFDERIYYFKDIPTHVDPFTVFFVAVGAIAIAVLASIFPARRAARLRPVQALRFE